MRGHLQLTYLLVEIHTLKNQVLGYPPYRIEHHVHETQDVQASVKLIAYMCT